MELNTPNEGSYYDGMYADPPVVKRVPANKSGKGTHLTTIRDQGECGPYLFCEVEYVAKHTPALNHIEVELGDVISVLRAYVIPVRYAEHNVIEQHDEQDLRTGNQWIDTANVLLTEHVALAERIEDEIRARIAG